MIDTYTPEEFANSFSRRGYGRKKDAMKWLEDHGIAAATEADFERCYHALNAPKITSRRSVLWGDGQNPSDPQHAPNSSGKSYNAEMVCGVKNGMQIGAFSGIIRPGKNRRWWWKKNTILEVTHWMPIPSTEGLE